MKSAFNVTEKLIKSHLLGGEMTPGKEIRLKIDQALLQDATGTLVMLELEAMGLQKSKIDLAVQYVDHNLLQTDYRNADDHNFLRSAAQKFGLWYSRPGTGVSHPVHMSKFGAPGATLLGSDSHTCAAGSMGMLAIGTGGMDVAQAIAGQPYYVKMPAVFGVELKGELPDWVSAKDVVLEMLRRYDVKGGVGYVIEYYGEGVKNLSAMDRHVIANMGAELGATTTTFPSDERTKEFLASQGRENDWEALVPDEGATYDKTDVINLSELVPLIAQPSSPGNVVPVSEVAGKPVHQCIIGSSANPGYRDFWIAGEIMEGKTVNPEVSFDINPTSNQIIREMQKSGTFGKLMSSGARFHQSGCMGCIGMGQAPASGKISLRTFPRNFPGRSGTLDDQVYLCSPETAAAAALTGKITDPRDLEKQYNLSYPAFKPVTLFDPIDDMLMPPTDSTDVALEKGPNIASIPELDAVKDNIEAPVLLKMEDNVSTDEILMAGSFVLPLRSNIPEISKWAYFPIRKGFYKEANEAREKFGNHIVIAGNNYAQGSSREHAALAPKYLRQIAVIAKSYARIGWQNLVNYGILPLEFIKDEDYDNINEKAVLKLIDVRKSLESGQPVKAINTATDHTFELKHSMSDRQIDIMLEGGIINYFKKELKT